MGEFFALATAISWASAVILFKRSGESVAPYALNLYRVGISSLVFALILCVAGEAVFGRAPLRDYLLLFLSGTIGIALSDTLFHRCLFTVGAGITAIVDCLYAPFVVLFAFLLLGERLGAWQFGGMALVIGGVLLAVQHQPPREATRRQILVGVIWGALAMASVALGVVIAKPVVERNDLLWATSVRQISCLLVMIPAALLMPRSARVFAVFRPTRNWRFTLPGTLLGSVVSLLLWLAGMKYTRAGTAAILNQTSTIYVLIFASLFLKEPFTRRKTAAAVIAVAGILMVTAG